MTRTVLIVLAAVLAQYPAPRPPEARPAVVIGQVVDAATGRGVRQAIVRIAGAGTTRTCVADERGRFYFRDLPAGSFTISAMRDGYFDGAFGRVRAGGEALQLPLAEGQWKADVEIPLFRPATISGEVDDEGGEPLTGIRVQAFRRAWSGGRERWMPAESTETDDLGLYRLHGLMPGEYVVAVPSVQVTVPIDSIEEVAQGGGTTRDIMAVLFMNRGSGGAARMIESMMTDPDDRNVRVLPHGATPPAWDGRRLAYSTLFYPAADGPDAAVTIRIGAAEHRAGVSFTLSPVPTVRVSGRLEGPEGAVPGLLLRLVRDGATDFGMGAETAITLSAPDGSFTLLDVPAGRYVLSARSAASAFRNWPWTGLAVSTPQLDAMTLDGPRELWGDLPLAVYDQDIGDVVVTASRGTKISGHVVFETGGEPPPAPAGVVLSLDAADGGDADLPPVRASAEGEFTIAGIRPGRYVIRTEIAPLGWYLESAIWQGQDATRDPVDTSAAGDIADVVVTLTDRPSRITGGVYSERGLVAPGARVIAVPAGRGPGVDPGAPPGRIQSVRANLYGVFELVGLQAGAYDLVAVAEEAGVRWQDPATLARLPGPVVRVTVAEGQTVQQSLVARAGRSRGPEDDHRTLGPWDLQTLGPSGISRPPAGVNRCATPGVEQENDQNRHL